LLQSIEVEGQHLTGLPNAHYFPYDTLEAAVALPNRWKPTPNDPLGSPREALGKPAVSEDRSASRILVPHQSSSTNILRKIDLTTALQYGTAQGYPPLYSFIRQFTREHLHPNVPYKDGAEIVLTCGSTDGFSKSLEAFSNPWDVERDWIREREGILCEEFAFMNAIQTAKPRGLNVVPVAVDDEGMLASGKGGLADVLEKWDKYQGKRPHLMYTVT
jgi:DNA-binding transcriptional MocR family regulator